MEKGELCRNADLWTGEARGEVKLWRDLQLELVTPGREEACITFFGGFPGREVRASRFSKCAHSCTLFPLPFLLLLSFLFSAAQLLEDLQDHARHQIRSPHHCQNCQQLLRKTHSGHLSDQLRSHYQDRIHFLLARGILLPLCPHSQDVTPRLPPPPPRLPRCPTRTRTRT